MVRLSSRVPSRSSSRASRRPMVARGTRSSIAARDSDFASTTRVNASNSAVSKGSLIWIIFERIVPFVRSVRNGRNRPLLVEDWTLCLAAPAVRWWRTGCCRPAREAPMKRLLFILCALIPACGFGIGNSTTSCTAGAACLCDGIGNCTRDCPAGGCQFLCRGLGNCNFTCEGGNCGVLCENTGNCILESCAGGCDVMCAGNLGNCICQGGCAPDAAMPVSDAAMPSRDAATRDSTRPL